MDSRLFGRLLFSFCVVAAAVTPAVSGQETLTAPVPSRQVAVQVDSGAVRNDGPDAAVIYHTTVRVTDAPWLRLNFTAVMLAGNRHGGDGSYLRITSLLDGAFQTLYAVDVEHWNYTSAYFNGEAVEIEIVAYPGTGPNRVLMTDVTAGIPDGAPDSICGLTDDRVLSSDPRAARLMPVGCTAWMIDDTNHCFLTAGHCGPPTSNGVVQFNVPLSTSSGNPVSPAPQDQYPIDTASIQTNGGAGIGDDWAYFGVNPSQGQTPFQRQGDFFVLAASPPAVSGQQIRITGYGTVSSPVSPTWNMVQKTHAGPYVSFSGSRLQYATDTTGGNSGSPVIDDSTGRAIGIHTHAGCTSSGGANNGTGSNHPGLRAALANPLGVCIPQSLAFSYPNGLPDLLDPAGGTRVRVEVRATGTTTPQPGTGRLHLDSGGGFASVPMQQITSNVYDAVFPAVPCPRTVRFYFSAQSTAGVTYTDPEDAPGSAYAAFSALAVATSFSDDFEQNRGWTVSGDATDGHWERGVPVNGARGDPPSDFDGSGQCQVTANRLGNSDVDNGCTILTSPAFDLAHGGRISYAYWINDIPSGPFGPGDGLFVEIATDAAGTNWAQVRSYTTARPQWRTDSVRVGAETLASATVRIRFRACDVEAASTVEAGLDAVRVELPSCVAGCPTFPGDVNRDGTLNALDIPSFADAMLTPPHFDPCADMAAPFGILDAADTAAFVAALLAP